MEIRRLRDVAGGVLRLPELRLARDGGLSPEKGERMQPSLWGKGRHRSWLPLVGRGRSGILAVSQTQTVARPTVPVPRGGGVFGQTAK